MQMERNREAFTLVELLLVVTIIGILAGAVLVNFSGKADEAKKTRASQDIATLSTALSMYDLTIGGFPTSEQGLKALVENPGVEGWKKPFLQRKIINDPWGSEYKYVYPGSKGIEYDLFSLGPDKQEGTEDDIGNWDKEQ